MRLRVISDGTPDGTKVVSAESGEDIEGVVAVTWSMYPQVEKTEVILVVDDVSCDIQFLKSDAAGVDDE